MRAVLARHVLYPLHERAMRRPIFSYLAGLKQTRWLSPAELQVFQLEKLRQLLVLDHCSWHARNTHDADLDPSQPTSLADRRPSRR